MSRENKLQGEIEQLRREKNNWYYYAMALEAYIRILEISTKAERMMHDAEKKAA